jgi:thioredoxin reductase (NADPH)
MEEHRPAAPEHRLRDVIIVGGGPTGLATAIAASQGGLDYEVLEKGVLVDSIFRFPRDMVFFTTPELLEIGGLPFTTPYEKPTRAEALSYYRRVADVYRLNVRFGTRVREIESSPNGAGPEFVVRSNEPAGGQHERRSRTVVVATGYYDHPNRLGIPGEDLPHVSHYFTEAHPYYRKRVVVVGGKNSAAEAALELRRAGAAATLVHRRSALGESIKYWVRPNIENRIKDGAIAARFDTRVLEICPDVVRVEGPSGRDEIPADAVFLLTGYHPDRDLLERAGVRVSDGSCKPEHDPQTFETNVSGLYVAGAIVSGNETNRIFIENGRFHGEAVAEAIRRRLCR